MTLKYAFFGFNCFRGDCGSIGFSTFRGDFLGDTFFLGLEGETAFLVGMARLSIAFCRASGIAALGLQVWGIGFWGLTFFFGCFLVEAGLRATSRLE